MATKTSKFKSPLFLKDRGGNLQRVGYVLMGKGCYVERGGGGWLLRM